MFLHIKRNPPGVHVVSYCWPISTWEEGEREKEGGRGSGRWGGREEREREGVREKKGGRGKEGGTDE